MDPSIEEAVGLLAEEPEQNDEALASEIESAVDAVMTKLDVEGDTVRLDQLREVRELVSYYEGYQNTYWDEGARDYRLLLNHPDEQIRMIAKRFNKIFNIFKAHADSIIAAVAVGTPSAVFFPEDADNPDDLDAAKAYSQAQEYIMARNNKETFFAEALFVLFTQHFVAAHIQNDEDAERYGVEREPVYDTVQYDSEINVCPTCSSTIEDEVDEIGLANCDTCGTVVPETGVSSEFNEELVSYEEYPNSRTRIDLYGSLNVKIPVGLRNQSCLPYLIRDVEEHIGYLRKKYPHIADKIQAEESPKPDESWARRPYPYTDQASLNQATERLAWLTPAAYELLDETQADLLRQTYPKGLCVAYVGRLLADIKSEELDAHWVISKSPTSLYMHQQPYGRVLIPIQNATNDMMNLTEETVKHSIPEAFASPRVLDFEEYAKTEAVPGATYPTKLVDPSQPLSHYFFERKPATLSQEVAEYARKLDEMGQFVPGDFPSVFGGVIQGGSGTAKEYELSRAAALQRLALTWKQINAWFPHVAKRACDILFDNMRKPLRSVKREGQGFLNVFINKPEGTIGDVKAESIEDFPVSWAQKSDRFFNLLNMQSPAIMPVIQDPENAELIKRLVGIPEARIGGSDDREKQLREIREMSRAEAPSPEEQMQLEQEAMMTGQPPQMPGFIPPDEFDNPGIHAEVTRAFLISPEGANLRNTNPYAFNLIVQHWQMHNMMLQPQAGTEQPAAEEETQVEA